MYLSSQTLRAWRSGRREAKHSKPRGVVGETRRAAKHSEPEGVLGGGGGGDQEGSLRHIDFMYLSWEEEEEEEEVVNYVRCVSRYAYVPL